MRYHEIVAESSASGSFYHGSKKPFAVGFVLTPQADGYVHGVYGDESDKLIRKTERILEKYRPPEMISRLQSVFLVARIGAVEHAGGQSKYIYQVEPVGAAEESCLWWYQEVESLAYQPRLDQRAAKIATLNYWNNAPPPEGLPATYEFRCRQATIVAIVRQPLRRVSEGDAATGKSVPLADTAETEISRAEWFGTYIASMSPDQYIALARRRTGGRPPLPNNLGGNMDRLRASIEQHGLQMLPWLSIDGDRIVGQEGLHRAAVLKNMGYDRMPVRIFAVRDGDRLDQDEAEAAYRKLVSTEHGR